MVIYKIFLILGCILHLSISLNLGSIKYKNKFGSNFKEGQKKAKTFLRKNEKSKNEPIMLISSNIEVNLYVVDSLYEKCKIPSDKKTFYKIDSGIKGTYRVTSGDTVTVSPDGYIYPSNYTVYHYGDIISVTPMPDKELTYFYVVYSKGKSIVSATVDSKTYEITVNVIDYDVEYVEEKMNSYIKTNVTNKKTQLDKLKSITAYPASLGYSDLYHNYMYMIIYEEGSCWGSTDIIVRLCEKVGIKARWRYGGNALSPTHQNALAIIDGKYYVCEAGYMGKPPRPYDVYEEILGYATTTNKKGLVIYQYDGEDLEINVPSKIDNKTVVGIESRFRVGTGKNATSITLPSTITFIGNKVFCGLINLKQITIPENVEEIGLDVFSESDNLEKILVNSKNRNFVSKADVLYNKNLTTIIYYPPGKKEDKYTGLSTLEKFGNYSFYFTKKVKSIIIPKTVKLIGDFAFGNSSISEIYFSGEPPVLGNNIFSNLNISIFYPTSYSDKWKVYSKPTSFGGIDLKWKTWTPTL